MKTRQTFTKIFLWRFMTFGTLCLLAFFVNITRHGTAQDLKTSPKIDSLAKVLKTVDGTASQARVFNQLSEAYKIISPSSAFEYAQEALRLAQKYKDVYEIASAYSNMGEYYLDIGAYQKALSYFDLTLKIAKQNNIKELEGNALNKIGVVHYLQTDYKACLVYQFEALKVLKTNKNKAFEAQALSLISYTYAKQGVYEKALDYHFKTLKLREELGDKNEIAKSYNSIGDFYREQQNYREALKNYREALKISEQIHSKRGQAISLDNIGLCYAFIHEIKASKQYHHRALKLKEELNIKKEIAISIRNIGFVFFVEGSLDSAMTYFKKAEIMEQALQNKEALIQISTDIAKVLIQKKEYTQAIPYLEKAVRDAEKLKFNHITKKNYELLYQLFAKMEDAPNLLKYYKKYDSLVKLSKNYELKDLNIESLKQKYEYEKRHKELELLKKENRINYLIIKQRNILTGILVMGIIVAIAFIALLYNRNKVKFRTNQRLTSINQEISSLNQKLKESEQQLKKSNKVKDKFLSIISHDLRAPLNSLISLIRMIGDDTNTFSPEQQKEIFVQLERQVQANILLTENMLNWSKAELDIIQFKPEMLDLNENLQAIIPLISHQIQKKQIHFVSEITANTPVYADRNMLHTILLNLVNNAIKFTAQHKKINIKTQETHNAYLQITLQDEGVGMTQEEIQKLFTAEHISKTGTSEEKGTGLGLLLCKEFVEKHRGTLTVESQKDKGSSFVFTLPHSQDAYQNIKPSV